MHIHPRTRVALACAALLAACSDPSAPAEPDAGPPLLPEGITEIRDVEAPLPADDFDALLPIIGDADVIGLGEAVHTTRGFSRMKARVFTYLVEHAGVRVFAFENPRYGAERVQAVLDECTAGTIADPTASATAAAGDLLGVWANDSMVELIEWMCAYNGAHPGDSLQFSGFDAQAPCRDAVELRDFLHSVDIDDAEGFADARACHNVPQPLVCGNLMQATITEEEHAQCIAGLDAIDALLDDRRDELIDASSEEAVTRARIASISLRGWQMLNYLDQIGDPKSGNEARDAAMAESFRLLRSVDYPDSRVAVWAHNWHLAMRNDGFEGEVVFRNFGTIVAEDLGADYVPIALVAYDVGVDWPGIYAGDVPAPTGERSVERLLHELGKETLLVDLDTPFLEPGVSYGIGTEPFEEGLSQVERVLPDHWDALIYLDRADAMRPLLW